MNYIQQYLELIPTFPFVIQVALYFIFLNTVLGLIFLFSVLFFRRRKRKVDELDWKFRPDNKSFLQNIFNSESVVEPAEINQKYVEQFGKIKKSTYIPMIGALEDLLKDKKDLLKDKNYLGIIRGLGIEDHLLKELKFSRTKKRLRNFQTISILGLSVPDSLILPFTYSRNIFLKKESRNSYAGISNHDPFKFFEQADNDVNYWDQIYLMQQLKTHHKDNLPNFSKWVKYSKNPSQLIFIVKAIAYFDQQSSAPSIVDLLDNPNQDLRETAIRSLGKMKYKAAELQMAESFKDQPQSCQNAIVESIVMINSGHSLPFLKQAYEEASNPDSRKLFAEAIYSYNDEGKYYMDNLYHQEDDFGKLIVRHVQNPLIPSRLKEDIKESNELINRHLQKSID